MLLDKSEKFKDNLSSVIFSSLSHQSRLHYFKIVISFYSTFLSVKMWIFEKLRLLRTIWTYKHILVTCFSLQLLSTVYFKQKSNQKVAKHMFSPFLSKHSNTKLFWVCYNKKNEQVYYSGRNFFILVNMQFQSGEYFFKF